MHILHRSKYLLLLCFLMLSSLAGFSQLKVGAKAGLTMSTTSTANQLARNSIITGGQLGAVVAVPVITGLSVQGEVLLTQKGSRIVFDQFNSIGNSSIYLEVPLLAKLTLGPTDFPMYATGGIYGAYWLSNINYTRQNGQRTARTTSPSSSVSNRFDTGLALGVGYQQALASGDLNVEVRYDHGIIGLVKNVGGNQNRSLVLSCGYLFEL